MKCALICAAALLVTGSLLAAEPKEDVLKAAKALAEKDNYSWTTKTERTRDTETTRNELTGMSEREGFTHMTTSFRNNSFEIVRKGDKGAVRTQEGWRSFAELQSNANNQNAGQGTGRLIDRLKAPAQEAEVLLEKVKDLKQQDDGYTGELDPQLAGELLQFGRGGGNSQVSDAKGTVTFWVEDGVLTKYSFEVEGTVRRDGNQAHAKRKSEVQVRDVGTTKVVIPDEAKTKAS